MVVTVGMRYMSLRVMTAETRQCWPSPAQWLMCGEMAAARVEAGVPADGVCVRGVGSDGSGDMRGM